MSKKVKQYGKEKKRKKKMAKMRYDLLKDNTSHQQVEKV